MDYNLLVKFSINQFKKYPELSTAIDCKEVRALAAENISRTNLLIYDEIGHIARSQLYTNVDEWSEVTTRLRKNSLEIERHDSEEAKALRKWVKSMKVLLLESERRLSKGAETENETTAQSFLKFKRMVVLQSYKDLFDELVSLYGRRADVYEDNLRVVDEFCKAENIEI